MAKRRQRVTKIEGAPEDQLIPVTVRFEPRQLLAIEEAAARILITRAEYIRMGALRECGWIDPKPPRIEKP